MVHRLRSEWPPFTERVTRPEAVMKKWKRSPEERSGEYYFSGRAVMTVGLEHELEMEKVLQISVDAR